MGVEDITLARGLQVQCPIPSSAPSQSWQFSDLRSHYGQRDPKSRPLSIPAKLSRQLVLRSRLAFTDLPVRLEIPLGESRLVIPSAWHHLTERLFIKAGSPE